VLADLVDGLGRGAGSPVLPLTTTHRYGEEIGALAAALRAGEADAGVATIGSNGFCWACLAGSVLVAAGGSALIGSDPCRSFGRPCARWS
jgi:hypothetical protein